MLAVASVILAVGALVLSGWHNDGRLGWDTRTYLAAGERLNAGHALYALGPGDRWIWINPPYWTVPILYPPPIAVMWRPLAILPNEWSIGIWTFVDTLLLGAAASWIVLRGSWTAAVAAAILVLRLRLGGERRESCTGSSSPPSSWWCTNGPGQGR